MKRERVKSYFLYGVFAFYLLLMAHILLFKNVSPMHLFNSGRIYHRSINFIPFSEIYNYLSGSLNTSPTAATYNVFGNIAIFIPIGIYLALFKKDKRVSVNILLVFLISLSVEIIQFVFGLGVSDIDDIFLNCLGGLIGILIYRGLVLLLKSEEKMRSIVSVFSTLVGLPILVLVILLIVNN